MEIKRYKIDDRKSEKFSYLFSHEHSEHLNGHGFVHVGVEPRYKNSILKHNQRATIFINDMGKYAQIQGKKEHIESAKHSLEIAAGIRLEEHHG
mgnify:CR=1 FL=1